MAILNVPGTYPTIAAAVAASAPTDTILIDAGYAGNEAVSVTVNNLTFSAPASVTGIVLTPAAGILRITLADASPIQIVGNASNNLFTGNNGDNIISDGGGGNDIIASGSGNDTITVTGGTDSVVGGGGAGDLLIVDYSLATAAVTSNSTSASDGGTRTVTFSGIERLHVVAGSGADTLGGTSGNDTLYGGTGNDTLDGGAGSNVLDGGDGNDTFFNIYGGTHTLTGGAGDDFFSVYGVTGTLNGGADTDTVQSNDLGGLSFGNVEVLDANNGYVYGTAGQLGSFATITDTTTPGSQIGMALRGAGGTIDFTTRVTGLHSVSVNDQGLSAAVDVTGTANNDIMTGSAYDDTLSSGAGNDALYGAGGNDSLYGGTGNDILEGGAGNNILDGGEGNDSIAYASNPGGTQVLTGGAGNDYFDLYGVVDPSDVGTVDGGADTDTVRAYELGSFSFSNVEVLDATAGVAYGTATQLSSFGTITDTNNPGSQIGMALRGAGGTVDFTTRVTGLHSVSVSDQGLTAGVAVTGSANSDTLNGSNFDDTLSGGAGNDELYGAGGNNILAGGDGNDTIAYAYNPGGTQILTGGAGDDLFALYGVAAPSDVGTVDGGADTDTVRAYELGSLSFSNVEVLDATAGVAYGTATQLSSFATITDSNNPGSQIGMYLSGAGGTVDFTQRVTGLHSVYVQDNGLTAGVAVTGKWRSSHRFQFRRLAGRRRGQRHPFRLWGQRLAVRRHWQRHPGRRDGEQHPGWR
jgi:serralysin